MAVTLEELKERLMDLDEITLVEVLNLSAKDIVGMFGEKIEEDFENIVKLVIEEDNFDEE